MQEMEESRDLLEHELATIERHVGGGGSKTNICYLLLYVLYHMICIIFLFLYVGGGGNDRDIYL